MAKVNQTKRIIAKMLTTNTGTHMLDSGGAYGRNWERNQGRDLEAEPIGTLEFRECNGNPEIDATLSLYHWLAERLEYVPSLDRRFYRWATRPSRADDPWLYSAEQFVSYLADREGGVTGIYGDGEPFAVNTCNGEDMLSQTIQFVYFEWDGDAYVLLQVHGGCDVRGGYTRPYAFQVSGYGDGTDILDNAKGSIYCTGEGAINVPDPNQLDLPDMPAPERGDHYWRTDDTCNWYYQGSAGYGAGTRLEEYDATTNPEERGTGKLYIDDDYNGYCPKCGSKLALSAH